jgi:hypothetical protein
MHPSCMEDFQRDHGGRWSCRCDGVHRSTREVNRCGSCSWDSTLRACGLEALVAVMYFVGFEVDLVEDGGDVLRKLWCS